MDFKELLDLQLMIFLLMGIGAVLKKINIITEQGADMLTNLVLYLFLPCSIIKSFDIKFDKSILYMCLIVITISCVIQCMCTFLNRILYNKVPKEQRVVLQYATVCSNAGLLGNPVAVEMFGSMGLLYASIYLIPQRIVMWSAGLSYFTNISDKKEIIKRVCTHPCIISVVFGLCMMIFNIQLPQFIDNTIISLGSCTTATSMILIGTILAGVNLKTVITKTTLKYSFIRLILIPIMVFIVCYILKINSLVMGVSVILAAMPAGSTTVILANKYNGDSIFATKCVLLTTALSMIIIPIWRIMLVLVEAIM